VAGSLVGLLVAAVELEVVAAGIVGLADGDLVHGGPPLDLRGGSRGGSEGDDGGDETHIDGGFGVVVFGGG